MNCKMCGRAKEEQRVVKRGYQEAKGERRSSHHSGNFLGASGTRQCQRERVGSLGNKKMPGKHYGAQECNMGAWEQSMGARER